MASDVGPQDYRTLVAAALQATVFHSATTYSWFGGTSAQLPRSVTRALSPQASRACLAANLRSQLYGDFYCRGQATRTVRKPFVLSSVEITAFVTELSEANAGHGCLEQGWHVRGSDEGRVIVRKEGLDLWVRHDNCVVPQDGPITAGVAVGLRFPKELRAISPAFYMALSDKGVLAEDARNLVRFYFNLTAPGAVCCMREVTSLLNGHGLPFKLKVLNDPDQFDRCDAVVLYVRRDDYPAAAGALGVVYPKIASALRLATPVFTKRLAAGIGLAEDPGPAESFGLHRCRLLAEAMIRGYEQDATTVDARLAAVEELFTGNGLTLDKPYLNPGSVDDYEFRPRPSGPLAGPAGDATRTAKAVSRKDGRLPSFLHTAEQIAGRLCNEAVWHAGRCNWLGTEATEHLSTHGAPVVTYSALGPTLYSGTGGIALFLAELHAVTSDPSARRTALGAIRQALSSVDRVPGLERFGLYTGWPGVALAAARVGMLLSDETVLRAAVRLLRRAATGRGGGSPFDLLSGRAGAIAALVTFSGMLKRAWPLDCAVRFADQIVRSADTSDGGDSWRAPALSKRHNLTGFSHGAAGIGYALFELYHASGEVRYRSAAVRAFDHERHWFDVAAGNWPDFRRGTAQRESPKPPASFATAWCHGAPGIALSRLRAVRLFGDEMCKAEAIAALQTTRKATETALSHGGENYSLCHGICGNAEVLTYGSQVLGGGAQNDRELAVEIARDGIEACGRRGSWPCGTAGGESPGLMLGLAGVGHFYLRLANPATPSILLVQPEDFSKESRASSEAAARRP